MHAHISAYHTSTHTDTRKQKRKKERRKEKRKKEKLSNKKTIENNSLSQTMYLIQLNKFKEAKTMIN